MPCLYLFDVNTVGVEEYAAIQMGTGCVKALPGLTSYGNETVRVFY